MSHASFCQQCPWSATAFCRHKSERWLCDLTFCRERTSPYEPKARWRMSSLVATALALVTSQALPRRAWVCALKDGELMEFVLQSLPLLGEVLLSRLCSAAYVDRSWLKQGLNIVVPQCDYSHIPGRWWKINAECIIVILLCNIFKSCLPLLFPFSKFDRKLGHNSPLFCI